LDARVLIFTIAISLLTGVLAGLAPALKTSRWHLSETLKEGGRGGEQRARPCAQPSWSQSRWRCAVPFDRAGLMIRSLSALWRVDPGFRPDNVLTFSLSLSPSMRTGSPDATRLLLRSLADQIASSPGIRGGFILGRPQFPWRARMTFSFGSRVSQTGESERMSMALVYRVEPGYLNGHGCSGSNTALLHRSDDQRLRPSW